ncbi:MAG: cell division protein FtsQ/DivIB [Alphaproteobacteria bacterium]
MRVLNDPIAAPEPRRDKTGRRIARRRVWPRWMRPAALAAGAILSIGSIGTFTALAWQDGWFARQVAAAGQGLLAMTADAGLALDDILVEGRLHTPREALVAAIGVGRGGPLLAIDPALVKQRLEGLPWVRSAAVERRLPGTVHVRLAERRPMAVWQRRGQLVLIDHQGHELGDEGIEYFPGLPFIVGEDAHRVAADMVALLAAEPALQPRVVAAIRVGGRRWNVRLDNGIEIWLPELGTREAWAEVVNLDRVHRLLDRQVSIVDLRDPQRISLRRHNEAATAPPADRVGKPAGRSGKKDRDA